MLTCVFFLPVGIKAVYLVLSARRGACVCAPAGVNCAERAIDVLAVDRLSRQAL